jgi:hypothetical protein
LDALPIVGEVMPAILPQRRGNVHHGREENIDNKGGPGVCYPKFAFRTKNLELSWNRITVLFN